MTDGRGRPLALRWLGGVAAAGLAAALATAGYQWLTWPDVVALRDGDPPTTAFMERYRQRQRERGQPADPLWQPVPYARVSVHLRRAVVAAEDMEFFSHRGFSSSELKQALREALQDLEAPRGASTITQQLAKNLWLSPSRSPLRKLKEFVLTRQLETHLSKRRILELYLNVVEFGPGVYGAEAAANRFFGMTAAGLSEEQAAELAAGLPRPGTWHPGVDSRSYRRYVAEIRRRMDAAPFLWRAVGADGPVSGPPPELTLPSVDSLVANLALPETDTAPTGRDSAPPER